MASTTPKDKDTTNNNNNNGGGIGKPLMYCAIFVGITAFFLNVLPKVGPKILLHSKVVETEQEAQAFFMWSTFDWDQFFEDAKRHTTTREWKERPGAMLAAEGASAKYPIVIVPGFTTSGLEVWGSEECGRKYFRTRFWGTMDQAKALLADQDCWVKHMTLHPYNGGDPSESIRMRPTEGMVAGDYFMAPYWVWGKLIENFNDVGYDPSNMAMMSYDWRLPFILTQERDGYFSKLMMQIESFHERHGEKVVLMAHSMGGMVVHYFMQWVTTPKEEGGGGGGEDWVDQHIESYANIAGALLGVPKAVSALLSGEMKDTSVLLGTIGDIVEQLFGRKNRKDLFATWGALWAMLPKGGDAMWELGTDGLPMLTLTDANTDITDEELEDVSDNERVRKAIITFASKANHTSSDLLELLLTWGAGFGPDIATNKFHNFKKEDTITQEHWHDVSVTPLPNAPSTTIYCLYGVGADTEVGYYYRTSWNGYEGDEDKCRNDRCDPPFLLNATVNDPELNIAYGVRNGDGDGSVPLVSLGQPCVGGWATKELNPSGTKVVTREYQDKSVFQVDDPLRGGPEAAIHVDILGNRAMTEDLVRIVTGHGIEKVEQRVISNIEEISKKIAESQK